MLSFWYFRGQGTNVLRVRTMSKMALNTEELPVNDKNLTLKEHSITFLPRRNEHLPIIRRMLKTSRPVLCFCLCPWPIGKLWKLTHPDLRMALNNGPSAIVVYVRYPGLYWNHAVTQSILFYFLFFFLNSH